MTLAVLRPDDLDLPLFVHVLGAMVLVGGLLAVVSSLLVAWGRDGEVGAVLTRFGLSTVFVVVLPSFIVMRVGAEWIYDKENFSGDDDPDWIGVGYLVADLGLVLLLIALVLAGIGLYRGRGGRPAPRILARVVAVIAAVLLAAYLVAVWAMTAKPG